MVNTHLCIPVPIPLVVTEEESDCFPNIQEKIIQGLQLRQEGQEDIGLLTNMPSYNLIGMSLSKYKLMLVETTEESAKKRSMLIQEIQPPPRIWWL